VDRNGERLGLIDCPLFAVLDSIRPGLIGLADDFDLDDVSGVDIEVV